MDVPFSEKQNMYTIAVIYRQPCNDAKTFLNALDEKIQSLNQKLTGTKTVTMGDINLDLNSTKITSSVSDYLVIIRSNAFLN